MAHELMNRNHRDMFDAMNDWFDFPSNFFEGREMNNLMRADVEESDHDYTVKVDLPGMNKNDIKLSYQNNLLTVAGKREQTSEERDAQKNLIHSERSYGRISRSFRLADIDANQIHAKYENGVLTINLPKLTETNNEHSITID